MESNSYYSNSGRLKFRIMRVALHFEEALLRQQSRIRIGETVQANPLVPQTTSWIAYLPRCRMTLACGRCWRRLMNMESGPAILVKPRILAKIITCTV